MANAYTDLAYKILQWSNRDPDVFDSNLTGERDSSTNRVTVTGNVGILADFMTYAADKAYRILRVPPLEKTIIYNPQSAIDVDTGLETNPMIAGNCLPVPADLIEFIHVRAVDAFGNGNSIVYNQKADTRTFHDFDSEKYDPRYTWTRQGNQILVPNVPGIQANCEYEVFYYGRLGRLDATYDASYHNYLLSVVEVNGAVYDPGTTALTEEEFEALDDDAKVGILAANWLRDENERIILFGALSEAFSYLGEDDMMQKFEQKFGEEIATLNKEEELRHSSGGNVQINFNGRGLI